MANQNGVCRELTGTLGFCTDNSQCLFAFLDYELKINLGVGGSFCDTSQQACVCPGMLYFITINFKLFLAGQIAVGGMCVELFARRWKRSVERCLRDENCLGRCGGLSGCRCERQLNAPGGLCQAPHNQYLSIHNSNHYHSSNLVDAVIGVGPGSPCDRSEIRCVNGSSCQAGYCVCPTNNVALSGACVLRLAGILLITNFVDFSHFSRTRRILR
jgi:hypothetical protein